MNPDLKLHKADSQVAPDFNSDDHPYCVPRGIECHSLQASGTTVSSKHGGKHWVFRNLIVHGHTRLSLPKDFKTS